MPNLLGERTPTRVPYTLLLLIAVILLSIECYMLNVRVREVETTMVRVLKMQKTAATYIEINARNIEALRSKAAPGMTFVADPLWFEGEKTGAIIALK